MERKMREATRARRELAREQNVRIGAAGRMAVPAELRLVALDPPGQQVQAVDSAEDPGMPAPRPCLPRIEWRGDSELSPGWTPGAPLQDCLWRFVQLGAASDEQILEFARRYGVLGICQHGLPGTYGVFAANRLLYPQQPANLAHWYWENPADWRELAADLRAYLSIGFQLQHGGPGRRADWIQVSNLLGWEQTIAGPDERFTLAAHLSYLILVADLNTVLLWSAGAQPRLVPGPSESDWPDFALFRVLVMQLVAASGAPHGIARCQRCANFYDPLGATPEDHPQLCAVCRTG